MEKIHILTSNKGKFRELGSMLKGLGYEAVQLELPHPELQSDSLEEVVLFKGEWARKAMPDVSLIADDSGLFIDALNGFPGVYSSFVYRTIGCDGILALLKNAKSRKERRARFECCLCYYSPRFRDPVVFKGVCNGTIAPAPAGGHGFGFDPIFIPGNGSRTFAQMTATEKNRVSHRGAASEKLIKFLKSKKCGN
jgi:XTP/dITP diphosphohydrolase